MNTPTPIKFATNLLRSPVRRIIRPTKKKAGSAPGTLVYTGHDREEPVRISIVEYDEEKVVEGVLTEPDFEGARGRPPVTWINIDGLNDLDLIQKVGNVFDLHPLTLEDLVSTGQRPKHEEYDDYLFVVLRMLTLEEESWRVNSEQVSLILGDGYVLSFQERTGDVWDPVRERIRTGTRIRKRQSDYLAYALIDAVVDHYFHVLERIAERVEELEVEVFKTPEIETMHAIHNLKHEMLVVRRAVWPLRELTSALTRTESPLISEETQIFLRDVHDHTVQVIDTTETFRDMISGLMDLYLSSVSNRMNEIMKVLTIMASIFIPLTFLAGVYGMNFQFMPELSIPWAYPALLGLMAAVGLGLVAFFRKRGWL
jgi:magnesium transporter